MRRVMAVMAYPQGVTVLWNALAAMLRGNRVPVAVSGNRTGAFAKIAAGPPKGLARVSVLAIAAEDQEQKDDGDDKPPAADPVKVTTRRAMRDYYNERGLLHWSGPSHKEEQERAFACWRSCRGG